MKRTLGLLLILIGGLTLVACDNEEMACGAGTVLVEGSCVLEESQDNEDNENNESICASDHTAYEVVNGDFLNAPAEPWFFIGGWMVNDPDSIWMPEYDAIIFDVTDAALAERNIWDGAFWQPKVYTEAGFTYTVSFTLRTDEVDGREVILFLEDTDNNYAKMFQETVTLGLEYQTFTYTYEALVDNNDTKVGLFFANDVGTVIIDSILIERSVTE
jgi:hypothetical protein